MGDTQTEVETAVQEGLKHPVMILTGGVSMGEFDYVDRALRAAGVETLFHKVAMTIHGNWLKSLGVNRNEPALALSMKLKV